MTIQPQSKLLQAVCHLIWFLYFPLFRDLDARAKSERYRALFRLPKDEKLDGHTDCTLWTPFNKMHILGQMFVSTNYICFTSKEETLCSLIIPLREVGRSTWMSVLTAWKIYVSLYLEDIKHLNHVNIVWDRVVTAHLLYKNIYP